MGRPRRAGGVRARVSSPRRRRAGRRLQRELARTVVCVALTSNLRWADAPGNVLLAARATGLPKPSVANVSQLVTLDREALAERAGRLSASSLELVLQASTRCSVGADAGLLKAGAARPRPRSGAPGRGSEAAGPGRGHFDCDAVAQAWAGRPQPRLRRFPPARRVSHARHEGRSVLVPDAPEADVAGGAVRGVAACGQSRGTGCSTSRGTGTSRRECTRRVPPGGPGGSSRAARPRRRAHRTSRHTTPRRCRSCCRGRRRSAGTHMTGAVPTYPSAPLFAVGKRPWKTFIRCSPPGLEFVAPGKRLPARPPRAAYSHSASVGRRLPAHERTPSRRSMTRGRRGDRGGRRWSMRALRVSPVGSEDLSPPRRSDDASRLLEVVREQSGEDE